MSTKIEWTDETWGPVTGCTKVSSGCKHCYAERLFPRIYGRESVGSLATGDYRQRKFTDVVCHPGRLDAPLHWKKPRQIFVNSMSDLFHEDVSFDFIDEVFANMALASQHKFQVLTKRPERMLAWLDHNPKRLHPEGAVAECTEARVGALCMKIARALGENVDSPNWDLFFDWPLANVWLGVSIEDQATADERVRLLLHIPAATRFASYEPALGPLELREEWISCPGGAEYGHGFSRTTVHAGCCVGRSRLNWLIAGGESGPRARPAHPDWFRSARDQCAAAGIPFFFKQWGEWADQGNLNERACAVALDGRATKSCCTEDFPRGAAGAERWQCMYRVGKKAAGRLLDGREHSEYPA